jgi:hypothetical protein
MRGTYIFLFSAIFNSGNLSRWNVAIYCSGTTLFTFAFLSISTIVECNTIITAVLVMLSYLALQLLKEIKLYVTLELLTITC